jgi:hypothetical protein
MRVRAVGPNGTVGARVTPALMDKSRASARGVKRSQPVSVDNKRVSGLALQKRKLENLELRLRGETRAFRPANKNQYWPETESVRANARNVVTFPQSLLTRQNNRTVWLGWKDSNLQMSILETVQKCL